MRPNSFKVRPPGFKRFSPKPDGGNKDIRVYSFGFPFSEEVPKRLMQSPQDCSGDH
jgi:hypothetical protein